MVAERPERVYLAHYGCVTGRIAEHAATLHRRLDQLLEVARAAPAGAGRHAAVKQGISGLLVAGLAAHGGPRAQAEALEWFDNDLSLNAQGLEVWLDGSTKS